MTSNQKTLGVDLIKKTVVDKPVSFYAEKKKTDYVWFSKLMRVIGKSILKRTA